MKTKKLSQYGIGIALLGGLLPTIGFASMGNLATTNVFLPLRNTPTADTAAALTYYPALNQKAEARLAAGEGIPNSTKLDVTGWDGVLTHARVGCAEGACSRFFMRHKNRDKPL